MWGSKKALKTIGSQDVGHQGIGPAAHVAQAAADHPLNEAGWADQPAEPQPRRQYLGKAADAQHALITVQGKEGGRQVSAVGQIAVDVVLDDQEVVALGQVEHRLAAVTGKGDAAGVLKVGDDVQQPRPLAAPGQGLQAAEEGLNLQAVVVGGDLKGVQAVIAEELQGLVVGWGFDQYPVSGVGEEGAQMVDGLGRAAGDHDLRALEGQPLFAGQLAADMVDQRAVALLGAVLQGQGCPLMEDSLGGAPQIVDRKGLGGRQAVDERDRSRRAGGLNGGEGIVSFGHSTRHLRPPLRSLPRC